MAIEEAFIMHRARQLYWQGYPPAEIARLMGINQNTIYSWKSVTSGTTRRLCSGLRRPLTPGSSSSPARTKDRRRLQGN